MRKVALTSLFLVMFNINGQNSSILPEFTSIHDINRNKINNNLIDKIKYVVDENEKNGLTLSENMPLFSPIRTDSLKQISDLFGMRKIHPVLKVPKFHFGVDFCAPLGTSVHTTASGTVEKVQYKRYGYGNNIIIDHGNGYKTRYAHLNEIFVNEGDSINFDDIIGTVGSTGMSTGNHLHYEVIFNNKPIDPSSFYLTASQRTKDDYLNVLINLEYTRNQLLANDKSFWTQLCVLTNNQNQT